MTLPAAEIRKRLIEITIKLMDTGGIDAVKARPIAKEVGISVGTIYNMFGSIDGLVQEANGLILEQFASVALAAIAEKQDQWAEGVSSGKLDTAAAMRARLLTIAETYMNFVAQNESRWQAMLVYNQNRSVEILSESYDQQQADLFQWLGNTIENTKLGATEDNRRMVARMLWSSVHGIVVLNYIGQANETSRAYTWQQIEAFVETFVLGVLAK
jgi:AcrR family transcriptional regulator